MWYSLHVICLMACAGRHDGRAETFTVASKHDGSATISYN